MLTGQSPFSGDSEEELFDSICNCNVPFPSFLAPSSIDYLKRVSLKIYMIALLREKEEIALTFDFFLFLVVGERSIEQVGLYRGQAPCERSSILLTH